MQLLVRLCWPPGTCWNELVFRPGWLVCLPVCLFFRRLVCHSRNHQPGCPSPDRGAIATVDGERETGQPERDNRTDGRGSRPGAYSHRPGLWPPRGGHTNTQRAMHDSNGAIWRPFLFDRQLTPETVQETRGRIANRWPGCGLLGEGSPVTSPAGLLGYFEGELG